MVIDRKPEQRRLPAHTLRALSVAAKCDPRTVARVVAGVPTKGVRREGVERALREAGLEYLIRGEDDRG
jgi:hypothetical protein